VLSVKTTPYADHVSLATMATKCAVHYTYKPSTLLEADFSPLQRWLYTSPISSFDCPNKDEGQTTVQEVPHYAVITFLGLNSFP
jgi:hypothetical protein